MGPLRCQSAHCHNAALLPGVYCGPCLYHMEFAESLRNSAYDGPMGIFEDISKEEPVSKCVGVTKDLDIDTDYTFEDEYDRTVSRMRKR